MLVEFQVTYSQRERIIEGLFISLEGEMKREGFVNKGLYHESMPNELGRLTLISYVYFDLERTSGGIRPNFLDDVVVFLMRTVASLAKVDCRLIPQEAQRHSPASNIPD